MPATIVTRINKGTPLTTVELDANLTNLNTVKLEDVDTRATVRPSLLLAFANTKKLDPRITFSRASSAAYYDGKTTALAEQNLILQSQALSVFSGGTYSGTATTSPDGTTTGNSFTEDTSTGLHRYSQVISITNYNTYTFSCYAKYSNCQYLRLSNGGVTTNANFDLLNGAVVSSTNILSTFINAVGNGWFRLGYTVSNINSGSFFIEMLDSLGITNSYTGSSRMVYIWGAQLEQRSNVTAYTPTTTAAITNYIPVIQTSANNAARFDNNPTTGESLGLFIEEQRTNLLTYSSNFDIGWSKSNASLYPNIIISPDGTLTASKVVMANTIVNNGATNDGILRSTAGLTASTTYTFSIFVHSGEFTKMRIRENTYSGSFTVIDIAAKSVTSLGWFTSATISDVGNGWCRLNLIKTLGASETQMFISLRADSTGDGYSGYYIWGAQLEAGAFATSYIPTPLTYSGRASTAIYVGDNGLIQSAAANIPRYQRNSVGGSQLLLEAAASNLLSNTQSPDASNWGVGAFNNWAKAIVIPKNAIAPDNTYSACAATFTIPTHTIAQRITVSASTTYTFSIWVKTINGSTQLSNLQLLIATGLSGALVSANYANSNVGSTVSSAWQRFSITFTTPASGVNQVECELSHAQGATPNYTVAVWGAQCESGSVATSYIPSTESFTSRAGTATYYDSGTVSLAEQNLIPYSQSFSTGWGSQYIVVTDNAVISPANTTTAASLVADGTANQHRLISITTSFTNALPYTYSVYVSGTGFFQLATGSAAFSSTSYANFNITNGIIGTVGAGCTATMSFVGSGWYRCSITTSATSTNNDAMQMCMVSGVNAVRTENTILSNTLYVWGAQVEQRSSLSVYTQTTAAITNYIPDLLTAPAGLARYDFDPVTRLYKGLTLEAQATNLLPASQDFGQSIWNKGTVVIATDKVAIAPDGTLSATKLYESASSSTHGIYQVVSATATTVYSGSIYFKQGERGFGGLQLLTDLGGTATRYSVVINLATGVLASTNSIGTPLNTSYNVSSVGNNWWRVSVTATNTAAGSIGLFPYISNVASPVLLNGFANYAGDGYSGIYIWGAQLETGSIATSYISNPVTFTSRASVATYISSNNTIQSAAANTARYQLNTIGGSQLLLESASSNLLNWTDKFDNAIWTKNTGVLVIPNTTVDPAGTQTADTIDWTAAAIGDGIYQGLAVTNGAFTRSIWIKGSVAGGTISLGNPYYAGSITPTLTTQWQLITLTTTAAAGYDGIWIKKTATSPSIVYLWGAQLELGSVATSYIPAIDVFTSRSTVASYYDASTTAKAEQNLLAYSQDFANPSGWAVAGGTIATTTLTTAPDNSNTVCILTSTLPADYINRIPDTVIGLSYVFSLYVKNIDATKSSIVARNGITAFSSVLNWTGSTLSSITGSAGNIVTLLDGWYRVDFLHTAVETGSRYKIYAGDGGSTTGNIYIWGAQLEQRSTVSKYTPTTTATITNNIPQIMSAAINTARIDYDPISRITKGLIIEAQATNVAFPSNNCSGSTDTTAIIILNNGIAPDGTNTATQMLPNGSGRYYSYYRYTIYNSNITGNITESIYFKPSAGMLSSGTFGCMTSNSSAGYFYYTFSTNTYVIGTSTVTALVVPVGNGWYRASTTWVDNSTSKVHELWIGRCAGLYSDCLLWGRQVEAGSVATSYIPTTTAQVTRAADVSTSTAQTRAADIYASPTTTRVADIGTSVANARSADVYSSSQVTRAADFASMTNSNFSSWYRQDEGTIMVSGIVSPNVDGSSANYYVSIGDGSSSTNMMGIAENNGTIGIMYSKGTLQFSQSLGSEPTSTETRVSALAYKNSDTNFSAIGLLAASSSNVSIPQADRLIIGNRPDLVSGVNSPILNGTIKRIAYYPKRLSNTEIQSITTT